MKYMKVKSVLMFLLSVGVIASVGFSIGAHADDEDEIDEEDIVIKSATVSQAVQQASGVKKTKMITKTVTDPATTVVVNELRTVELADGDRDGLVDTEDPHPNIPEVYLVKDDNSNGIVDTFENYAIQ